MNKFVPVCAAALAALAIPQAAPAENTETVAVIGTGHVGSALGPQFARLGHPVIYGSRDPSQDKVRKLVERTGGGARAAKSREAAAQAQIVVLAVPWSAAQETVRGMGDLSGKIIIDITNAFAPGRDRLMAMVVDSSGGELIQSWAPRAKVVKAFNAMSATVMANPAIAGGPVTVPLAGDDTAAKARVAEIVRGMGFETADVGPIRHARWLEGMTILYLTPVMTGRAQDSFEFYFRPRSRG